MAEDKHEILDYHTQPDKPSEAPVKESAFSRFLSFAFYASFALFLLGNYFRNAHYVFGSQMLIISCSALAMTGVMRNLIGYKRNIENYFLAAVFAILPIGFLFNTMHWPSGDAIFLVGKITLLVWLLLRVLMLMRKR